MDFMKRSYTDTSNSWIKINTYRKSSVALFRNTHVGQTLNESRSILKRNRKRSVQSIISDEQCVCSSTLEPLFDDNQIASKRSYNCLLTNSHVFRTLFLSCYMRCQAKPQVFPRWVSILHTNLMTLRAADLDHQYPERRVGARVALTNGQS